MVSIITYSLLIYPATLITVLIRQTAFIRQWRNNGNTMEQYASF